MKAKQKFPVALAFGFAAFLFFLAFASNIAIVSFLNL